MPAANPPLRHGRRVERGGPYIVDLDEDGAGSVVAVNISGDDTFSYGTALGAFARRLYAKSEHCSRDC